MAQNKRKTLTSGAQIGTFEIEGNTIRKAHAVPARRDVHEKSRILEKRKKRQELRRTARNRERALYMSPVYVMFLMMCTSVLFSICGIYIYLQSQITGHISAISSLESEIIDLRSDNDETELYIETSADLDAIKSRAFALGMQYPTADQIIYYSVDETDYMKQTR